MTNNFVNKLSYMSSPIVQNKVQIEAAIFYLTLKQIIFCMK